jgi:hypothetical protein
MSRDASVLRHCNNNEQANSLKIRVELIFDGTWNLFRFRASFQTSQNTPSHSGFAESSIAAKPTAIGHAPVSFPQPK